MQILNMSWLEFLLNIAGLSGLTQAIKQALDLKTKVQTIGALVLVALLLSWLRYKSGFWYVITRDTLVFSGLAGALWDFVYSRWGK